MSKEPGPTPAWFGQPEPPARPQGSGGRVVVAVLITFAATIMVCGTVGAGAYGVLQARSQVEAERCAAQLAMREREAETELRAAELACEKKLAEAERSCATSKERELEAEAKRHDSVDDPGASNTVEDAAEVIRNARGRFRSCYEDVLRADPDAEGRVDLRLEVSPSGRVNSARLVGGPLADKMRSCVVEKASALRFPASDKAKTISVPFVFVH